MTATPDETVYHGKSASVLIGKEAIYGTGVACTKDVGLVQSFTLNQTREVEEVFTIGSRDRQHAVTTRFRATGSMEVIYQHSRLIAYALGAIDTAGAENPYTHTITAANLVPSFTIQATQSHAATGTKYTVDGCKIGSLRISAEKGSLLKLNADFVAQSVTKATTTASATLDDIIPAAPSGVTVEIGTDLAAPSSALPGLQSWELNYDNGFEIFESCGSVEITEPVAGQRKYTGTFTLAADDASAVSETLARVLGTTTDTTPQTEATPFALELNWTNGLTPADELHLSLYGCKITEVSLPYTSDGASYVDFTFSASTLGVCTAKDDISGENYPNFP